MSASDVNDDPMNAFTDGAGARSPEPAPPAPERAPGGEEARAEDEIRRLREALEAKTREAEAQYDRHLRAVAEFDNFRKRAARDREEHTRYANESLIRELLPVLDNFERALQAARGDPAAAAVTAGVELIQRELLRVLEKFGVTAFTSVGEPFDPERHEAVARVHDAAHPEMTVIGEQARGYLLNGRVLRPAMVTVAMAPESSAGDSAAS
jgi:molecular chaperone GrpE